MQVQSVNSNQSFRGIGSAFKGIANTLDYTAQATSDIADLVTTAGLTMDTPDIATVKILNDKLNTVSNNKSVPKPVRKSIKYTCCAIATGLTFFITRNCLRGRGILVDMFAKSKLGKSTQNFVSSMKDRIAKMKLTKTVKNSFIKTGFEKVLTTAKNTVNSSIKLANNLLDKTPKIKSAFNGVVDFLNIKNWTKRDYFANTVATYIAGHHAAKALKTPEQATQPEVPIIEKPIDTASIIEPDAPQPDVDTVETTNDEIKDAA